MNIAFSVFNQNRLKYFGQIRLRPALFKLSFDKLVDSQ